MRTRKTATILLSVFLAFLLVFTFYGDDLRRLTVPKVTVDSVKKKKLPVTIETSVGTVTTEQGALVVCPDAVVDDMVYMLYESEAGWYVMSKAVKTGRSGEDWVEVISGIGSKSQVVSGSDRELWDGREVIVLPETTEQIRLYRSGTKAQKEQFVKRCKKANTKSAIISATILFAGGGLLFLVCRKRFRLLLAPLLVVLCIVSAGYYVKHVEVYGEYMPERLIDG